MVPPFAADGGSNDEREDGDDTENKCGGLPSACPLLLLNGEVLLSIQTLLFLGELLFGGNSSLSFLSGVAEQGMGLWGVHDEREHHEDDESFHISIPFLEMGTKKRAC